MILQTILSRSLAKDVSITAARYTPDWQWSHQNGQKYYLDSTNSVSDQF